MKKYRPIVLLIICFLLLVGCGKKEKHEIEILVPAGSSEAFVCSDEEICPIGNKITIWAGAGLGDTEVILKPVNENVETGYVAEYLTHGGPVEFDTSKVKDQWFKIGVSVQNDSDRGPIAVSVEVEGVEVRIAEGKVPSIIYQGSLYRTTGKQIPAEVDESAIVGEISSVVPLTQLPTKEGEANFGEIGDQYAITSDGLLVKMNNEWTLFELPDIEVEETITYNGKEYKKSELCDATLHWLELSEQERMFSSYMPPEFMIFEETWGITLTAENVTQTSATIKCTQSDGEPTGELQTGSWYILENWTQENGWKEMPYVIDGEIGWTSEAWMIPMNGTCEWEINWEWLYGTIPEGKYRIGKELMDFRGPGDFDKAIYFVEFSIE